MYKGKVVYILRQVDNFSLVCKHESTAIAIYGDIRKALQLPKEDKPPFTYLGLMDNFNGIGVELAQQYIQISCSNYIDRIMTSNGWSSEKSMLPASKPIYPRFQRTVSVNCPSTKVRLKGPLNILNYNRSLGFLIEPYLAK